MQYGCGFSAPDNWLNFDASPTLRFERLPFVGRLYTRNAQRFPHNVRYGDIVRGLPLEQESCQGIYCSHILEHLTRDECEQALANTFLYLRSNGLFRLVVPDLMHLANDYLRHGDADRFMHDSGLGKQCRSFIRDLIGNSSHLWLWDERSMTGLLAKVGFAIIRRCYYGDCQDPRFREVENEERFRECLAIECKKA